MTIMIHNHCLIKKTFFPILSRTDLLHLPENSKTRLIENIFTLTPAFTLTKPLSLSLTLTLTLPLKRNNVFRLTK